MPDYDKASNQECFQGNKVTFQLVGNDFKLEKAEWIDLKVRNDAIAFAMEAAARSIIKEKAD